MRRSLYWDLFDERATETAFAIKRNESPTIRRVAIFVTDRCNLSCSYCNANKCRNTISQEKFDQIVKTHGRNAIIHITGGEPSIVSWLYPYLKEHSIDNRFHLNTNAIIMPPAEHVKRLKISLDSCNSNYWDSLVGMNGAFNKVVDNIKNCLDKTTVSITYTLTKETYKNVIPFIEFAQREFPGLYAIFFSVYKGTNERFAFTELLEANDFFFNIKPKMEEILYDESKALLKESLDEKYRIIQGERFPENNKSVCYLSLSERVFDWNGEYGCSHLYRDHIFIEPGKMHEKCKYGCNRRLVEFNQVVESLIK